MNAPQTRLGRFALRVLLLGHAVQWLSLALTITFANDGFRYPGFLGAGLQIAAAAYSVPAFARTRYGPVVVVFFGYVAWLGVFGFMRGNWAPFLALDIVAFGTLATIACAVTPGATEAVARLYAWLLPIGSAVALVVLADLEPASVGQRVVGRAEGNVFLIPAMCAPALFVAMVPSSSRTWFVDLNVVTGLAVMILFGVLTATRGPVLGAVAALAVWTTRRNAGNRALGVAVVVGVGLLTVGSTLWSISGLARSGSALVDRFSDGDLTSGRAVESEYFVDVSSGDELAWGRGLGASYYGTIPGNFYHGLNMVHYGHLHLVLKGGVLLSAGLLGLTLFAAFRRYARRKVLGAGDASFLLVFLMLNEMHTQFVPQPLLGLFALALGSALLE